MTDWKGELEHIIKENKTNESKQRKLDKTHFEKSFEFLNTIVLSAFQEIKTELEKYDREVNIFEPFESRVIIEIKKKEKIKFDFGTRIHEETFRFGIRVQNYSPFAFYSYYNHGFPGNSDKEAGYSENVSLKNGNPYTIKDVTKDEIIQKFLSIYQNFK